MTAYITENIGTIITAAIILAVIAGAIAAIVINRKKGKSSCGCGCSNCALADKCHKERNQNN